MLKPVVTGEGHKSDGECDADSVVRKPPYHTFCALWWRKCNIGVLNNSFWHILKPASDETDIGGRQFEGVFEKHPPKIKRERGAEPNEDRLNEGKRERMPMMHESPADERFICRVTLPVPRSTYRAG